MDKQQLTAGNAASWAVGATLGVLLGVTLLIATPRTMFPHSATDEKTPTAVAATEDGSGATKGATTLGEAENPESGGEASAQGNQETAADGNQTASSDGDQATAPAEETSTETASSESGTSEQAAPEGETPAGETTVAASTGNAEAGKDAYATCAGCHGAEGQGGVGPALNAAAGWSDAEFTTALREGKTPEKELAPTMPRFAEAQVSNQQIADLHAYIKTLN